MTGLIFDIARDSYVDGPGIRTTFFMKGCHMRCQWCHNPEGQSFEPEMMFFRNKCVNCGNCRKVCRHPDKCILCGECAEVCPTDARRLAGKRFTAAEVLAIAEKDKPYFGSTGGGVTFSGGECMLQADFLAESGVLLHKREINVAIDTAGDVDFGEFEKVLPHADLFLYDIKCIDEAKHRVFTGVSNRRIIDNFKRIYDIAPQKLVVRIPVVPGFNGNLEDMEDIASFLKPMRLIPELLPYHAMGEGKAIALGKEVRTFHAPTADEMSAYAKLFAV